jgi:hypothetical protein
MGKPEEKSDESNNAGEQVIVPVIPAKIHTVSSGEKYTYLS